MAAQQGNIVTPPHARSPVAPKPSAPKGTFPRPMGGPEPSAQGASDNIPDSNAPYSPGYDYSGSMDGASTAEIRAGIRGRSRITDAGSDGMQGT